MLERRDLFGGQVFVGDATPTYGGFGDAGGLRRRSGWHPRRWLNAFSRVRFAYPGYAGIRLMKAVSRVFVGDVTPRVRFAYGS